MFVAFLGQFRSAVKEPEEDEGKRKEKSSEEKSESSEEFIKTPEARDFVNKWTEKERNGQMIYTRRGLTDLLGTLFQVPGLDTNRKVLAAADKILLKLGGMDGLQGFLMGWKAKSEGILKGLKSIMGK